MLANVQQKTIQPIIEATVARNALIYTDEYDIYARLEAWGYRHKAVPDYPSHASISAPVSPRRSRWRSRARVTVVHRPGA